MLFGVGGAEFVVHGGEAGVDMEAFVGSYEGLFGPICLLQPAPGGPVVSIPQAGVYLHRLIEGEFDSQTCVVLEHPDWYVVHVKSVYPSQHQYQVYVVVIKLIKVIR